MAGRRSMSRSTQPRVGWSSLRILSSPHLRTGVCYMYINIYIYIVYIGYIYIYLCICRCVEKLIVRSHGVKDNVECVHITHWEVSLVMLAMNM